MPAHPLPGSCCQPDNPTHLSSKVFPANRVLGAVGVIPVAPMQVQLCGTVAGREALDVHGWGQLQLHCREWRGNLQSQADNTCLGPRQGAVGCSKVGTRENRGTRESAGQKSDLFPWEPPYFTKAIPVAPGPSWFPVENDGRNTNTRPRDGCLFIYSHIILLTMKMEL